AVPLVYVTGGAQGSHRINRVVGAALGPLVAGCQLVHQCGSNEYDDAGWLAGQAEALPPAARARYRVVPFVTDALADLYPATPPPRWWWGAPAPAPSPSCARWAGPRSSSRCPEPAGTSRPPTPGSSPTPGRPSWFRTATCRPSGWSAWSASCSARPAGSSRWP